MLQLLSLLHVIICIVKPKETKSINSSLCFNRVGQKLFEKIADCLKEQFWHICPLISLNLNLISIWSCCMQRYDGWPECKISSCRNWPPKGPINVCWTEEKEKYFKLIKYKKFPLEELNKKMKKNYHEPTFMLWKHLSTESSLISDNSSFAKIKTVCAFVQHYPHRCPMPAL